MCYNINCSIKSPLKVFNGHFLKFVLRLWQLFSDEQASCLVPTCQITWSHMGSDPIGVWGVLE